MTKIIMKSSSIFVGSMASICILATIAIGNPALLPAHPGHEMDIQNDQSNQDRMGGGDQMDSQKHMVEMNMRGGQNPMANQNQMGDQNSLRGQEPMIGKNSSGDQKQPGQNQTNGPSQIKSQSQTNGGEQNMNIGGQIDRPDEKLQGPRDSKLEGY